MGAALDWHPLRLLLPSRTWAGSALRGVASPEAWMGDRERCRAVKIPEELAPQHLRPGRLPTKPASPALYSWPHVDRHGRTAATEGTTGTVDLAEEDHNVVRICSCRLQVTHDRREEQALPFLLSP